MNILRIYLQGFGKITLVLFLMVFMSNASSSTALSVALLPSHIKADDGKVSLFADYGSKQTDGRVPVYLINKSSEDFVLDSVTGRVFLKLQYLDSTGSWVRAEPERYEWCGTGKFWGPITVSPGDYLLMNGYQPVKGVSRTIRYHIYAWNDGFGPKGIEISSNAGDGIVADWDIQYASIDVMTVSNGTFEDVSRIALTEIPEGSEMAYMIYEMVQLAVFELASGRFDPEESRKILVQVRGKTPLMAKEVDWALNKLEQR